MLGTSANRSAKSANCRLKVWVCGFANRFFTANICGFAVKKLKSTANSQINYITGIVSAVFKNTYLRSNISTDLGECISKPQHPLTNFLCCGTIISQRCCYSYSKMSWFKVKKVPTACYCEGKLRRFEVAKGCT